MNENSNLNQAAVVLNDAVVVGTGHPRIWEIINTNNYPSVKAFSLIQVEDFMLVFAPRIQGSSIMTITIGGGDRDLLGITENHLVGIGVKRNVSLERQILIKDTVNQDTVDAILDYDGTGDNIYLSVAQKHGLVFLGAPYESDMDERVVPVSINGRKYFFPVVFTCLNLGEMKQHITQEEIEWIMESISKYNPKLNCKIEEFRELPDETNFDALRIEVGS